MTYDSEVLADSPLFYWRLDDALASATAADASGNGRPGGVSNWTFRLPSQFAGSSFGSTPTNINGVISSPSIAFGTSQVTVEMWVNFNGTTGTYMLCAFGIFFLDLIVDMGRIGINTGIGDQYGCAIPGAGVHHIVAVMPNAQATTNAKIYIDGTLQTLSGTSGTAGTIGTTYIQISNWPGTGQPIPNGVYIDNVAVYLGALSAGRVSVHHAAGTQSNDLFVNAVSILVAGTSSAPTSGFTVEAGEILTCPTSATGWYYLTPTTSGVYQIDTIGSDYDTGLALYTGDTLSGLHQIAYDDNSGGSSTSRLVLELVGGTLYYIQGGAGPNASSANGVLTVNVSANLGPAPDVGWGHHA